MNSLIHILHLEDRQSDAKLVECTLEAEGIGCAISRVKTRDEFVAAIEGGGIDLILSDHSLPGFDGISALKIARASCAAIPFVFVSGTLGEERAIESLKSGATDYVLKDRIARLGPAVRRAMQEATDRAERDRLQLQFIEAQKMEVIGLLAGGVAHDFNNILAVILGYCEFMMVDLAPDDERKNQLEVIQSAAERAVGLTRQLLIFSRKETVQPVVLDVNAVVKNTDKMLRRLIHENIEMTVLPGEAIGRIMADAGHVGQVLMNLVVNARDAMPNGGRLTIATSNVTLDENYAQAHTGAMTGDFVMLSVSDTGTGMTEEVKAHVFEAFFTTKPKGKGTGLGLATCQTIVQQSGGYIALESEVGSGTTFKIYFPRVEQPVGAAAGAIQTEPLPCGTETLLVVEDESSVRNLARCVLEARGYTVLSASNGQEGMRVVRDHKGPPIQLVVTDVVMPQMGGKVMAEWLQAGNPDIRILFTSGYADGAITQNGVLEAGLEFLPKPYASATLVRKVRAMLDQSNVST
jgi:two-component system, cell cycle sensor histidine kinase and response regulator CckA